MTSPRGPEAASGLPAPGTLTPCYTWLPALTPVPPAVAAHWGELPPREQKILLMRFHQDMTQAQIGQQLGISQMQVSRLLARALGYLRHRLLSQHKHALAASPAVPTLASGA